MDADLIAYLQAMEERLTHVFVGNLGDLRTEVVTRMDILDKRMDNLERSMNHLSLTVMQVDAKCTSLNRLIGGHSEDVRSVLSSQSAFQKAIDDLSERVKRLEGGGRAA